MLSTLGPALALLLVIEGVVPFFSPSSWRSAMLRVTSMADGQIRFVGMASMLAGLLLYWLLA